MPNSRLLLGLGLAACNQVLGNHSVEQSPNAIFDAPLDAPFSCPPIGVTPQFSSLLHQYAPDDCIFYGETHGEAIASCSTGVLIAPIGMPLAPALGIPPLDIGSPRLSPDGTYMLVQQAPGPVTQQYLRVGDAWTLGPPQSLSTKGELGNIVHVGGSDRMLAHPQTGFEAFDELVFDGTDTWTVLAKHPNSELGIPFDETWLTNDGLRLIASNGEQVYYSDRPTIDLPFRTAELLDVPTTSTPTLTDDCSRIYVAGIGSIFFEQRL